MSKLPEKKNEASIQSALLEIVQRTDIDPERLEKFLDLQIMMEERQAQAALNKALASFQSECPIITRKKQGHNSKYAPLDEIVYQIKPVLDRNGLSFTFNTKKKNESEKEMIVTIRHKDGASFDSVYTFSSIDDGGKMNTSQRIRSANSYAKRTALENALGVVTAGEDDDAGRAIDSPVNAGQLAEIKDLLGVTKTKEDAFLKYLGVENFEGLSFEGGKKAIYALRTKRDKNVS